MMPSNTAFAHLSRAQPRPLTSTGFRSSRDEGSDLVTGWVRRPGANRALLATASAACRRSGSRSLTTTPPEFAVPDVVDSPVTSKPPSGRAVRWLLEHRVSPPGPEATEDHAKPQAWWKVMC